MWAYFDETYAYEPKKDDPQTMVPTTLIVGGCFSSASKWKDFEVDWKKALDDEKVSAFHAKDFYSFKREFEWFKDGERDWARHGNFRDRLADIITEYADEAVAFTSEIPLGAGEKGVLRRAYKDGVFKVLNNLSWFTLRGDGAYVLFARHRDISPFLMLRFFEQFNWDNSLRGIGIFEPTEVLPLQAADFICHTINRTWNGAEAKSHDRLAEGFRKRSKHFSVQLFTSAKTPDVFFQELSS